MRHATHRVRFWKDGGERSPTGAWDQTHVAVTIEDVGAGWDVHEDGTIDAGVGEPTVEAGEVVDPSRVDARVRRHVRVDPNWYVEVLDHSIHNGFYRITSISGGRRVTLMSLRRWHRQDGTHGTQ